MVRVVFTPEAQEEAIKVPRPIQVRITAIANRLQNWPDVSGAKAMRGELAGNFRIRTGDYRLVFRVSPDGQTVTVWRIGHRGGVYD